MVSTRGVRFKFSEGERVLCYEPDPTKAKVLYDSKVLEVVETKETRGRRHVEYLIHFQGWNSSWDRCVGEDHVLKDTEENRQLQRDLAEKSQLQLGAYLYRRSERKKRVSSSGTGSSGKRTRSQGFEDDASSSSTPHEAGEVGDTDSSQDSTGAGRAPPPAAPQQPAPPAPAPAGRAAIVLPAALRDRLTFDYHLVVKRGRLSSLPACPTVLDILEGFVRWYGRTGVWQNVKRQGRRRNRQSATSDPPDLTTEEFNDIIERMNLIRELVDGLRIYFDYLIKGHLLYKQEINQYHEIANCIMRKKMLCQPLPGSSNFAFPAKRVKAEPSEEERVKEKPEFIDEDKETLARTFQCGKVYSNSKKVASTDRDQSKETFDINMPSTSGVKPKVKTERIATPRVETVKQTPKDQESPTYYTEQVHSSKDTSTVKAADKKNEPIPPIKIKIRKEKEDKKKRRSQKDVDEEFIPRKELTIKKEIEMEKGSLKMKIRNAKNKSSKNKEKSEDKDYSPNPMKKSSKEKEKKGGSLKILIKHGNDRESSSKRKEKTVEKNADKDSVKVASIKKEINSEKGSLKIRITNAKGKELSRKDKSAKSEKRSKESKRDTCVKRDNDEEIGPSAEKERSSNEISEPRPSTSRDTHSTKIVLDQDEPFLNKPKPEPIKRRLRSHKSSNNSEAGDEQEGPRNAVMETLRVTDPVQHSNLVKVAEARVAAAGTRRTLRARAPAPDAVEPSLLAGPLAAYFEKVEQWQIIPKENTETMPCRIYGAVHLCRLFVKLPQYLNAINMPDTKLKQLLKHIEIFIHYLEDHEEWFGENYYHIAETTCSRSP